MKFADATPEERDFWDQVYISVARSDACKDKAVPATWADNALQERRERFGRSGDGPKRYDRL